MVDPTLPFQTSTIGAARCASFSQIFCVKQASLAYRMTQRNAAQPMLDERIQQPRQNLEYYRPLMRRNPSASVMQQ